MSDNKATDPADITQPVDENQPVNDTQTVDNIQPIDNTFKKYVPIVTVLCCAISIILFAGINFEGRPFTEEAYKNWGSLIISDLFDGGYWRLISSNFSHTEIWHIGFNLYWLWIFGKKIEFESNKLYYLLLISSSALVSSLAELSFSNSSGIGLSGICYSLFGFIFIKSKTTDAYKKYLDRGTIYLFFVWLIVCIFLTTTKVFAVGNAAHIGGLLWGTFLAYLTRFENVKQWAGGLLFVFTLATSIWWSPFSVSLLSYQASQLHYNQKFDEAMALYRKILQRDADNEFARSNLQQLEVHQLQEKAFGLHSDKQYQEARQIYNQILTIDKDNQWAKDNLKLLPAE